MNSSKQQKRIGFVGWRGMVGQVLMQRMIEEQDFKLGQFTFFSSGMAGRPVQFENQLFGEAQNSHDLEMLTDMDIILTCQGGDYTKEIYPELRKRGWKGDWIDAASALRMDSESIIVLDPLNLPMIQNFRENGGRTFVGGNCTVSLMLLAIQGLLREDLVSWVSSMTYQAASGAGAKNMEELVAQYGYIDQALKKHAGNNLNALSLEKEVNQAALSDDLPKSNFGRALGYNLLPWIDSEVEMGMSREEWKGMVEANKILGRGQGQELAVDGLCVRVGSLRCHSQGLTLKLKKSTSLATIEELVRTGNQWVRFVSNNKQETLEKLTPVSVSGTLDIAIGRIRPSKLGADYIHAFTVGDQLLWGAAEPLRRVLRLILTGNVQ